MKFLEVLSLQKVTSTLQKCDLGDRIIHGRVEAYSCKRAGADKRLSKEIQRQLAEETTSLSPLATSPLGPLKSSSTRKLLISLITTLNASFPDYDFSNLRSEHFEHEKNVMTAMDTINNLLLNSMEPFHSGFRDEFWSAIDETIELNTCEIYTYVPDADTDVFALGKLWSVNYFFYSKKRKMIVFFTANAVSKLHQHTIKHIHHRRTTTDVSDDDDEDDDGSDESIDDDDDDLSEDDRDMTEDGDDEYEPRGYVDVQLLDWDEVDIQETSATTSTSTSTSTTVSTSTTPSSLTDSTSSARSRSKKSTPRKHPRSTPTKLLPIKKSKFTPVDEITSFSPSSTNSSHQIPSFSPIVTSMASDFGGLATSSPLMKPVSLPAAPIDFHEHKSISISDRRP